MVKYMHQHVSLGYYYMKTFINVHAVAASIIKNSNVWIFSTSFRPFYSDYIHYIGG